MNKKLLCLSLLAIFGFPTLISNASSGTYTWSWTQCNAITVHGTLIIQANIGVSSVTISWTVPQWSFENNWGCARNYLTGLEVSAVVVHPSYIGLWDSWSSIAASNTITLPLRVQSCNYVLHYCTQPRPYNPVYGDYVTVSITAIYNGNDHGTTDTLKITS